MISEKFSNFVVKVFDSSSIHGFPYISRRDLHLIEKLFWITILTVSFWCAYYAFSGQFQRYNENPTVLSVQVITFGEFAKPSFTVCTTNYTNMDKVHELAERIFNVQNTSVNYENYTRFIERIARTNYHNLHRLDAFLNLSNIRQVNFLEIANEMHADYPLVGSNFERVMTELNMCQSSSEYFFFQSPKHINLSKSQIMNDKKGENCSSLEVCRVTVTPNNLNTYAVNRIYINSFDEIMSGDDFGYVELSGTSIQERSIKLDEIVADQNIRKFKPKSRKCRFSDESNLKYYDTYSSNLCKMTCRINRALQFCKCVPFFYTIKNVKFCDIEGLLCLAKTKWYNASSCNCMNLCESTILTKLSSINQNLQFDRMLTIDMIFPKTRIYRSVLFDFDDLLVGLGGSLALFLGLSVLCIIEIMYCIIECCMEIIINCIKS